MHNSDSGRRVRHKKQASNAFLSGVGYADRPPTYFVDNQYFTSVLLCIVFVSALLCAAQPPKRSLQNIKSLYPKQY
jgi:hypothetical protein